MSRPRTECRECGRIIECTDEFCPHCGERSLYRDNERTELAMYSENLARMDRRRRLNSWVLAILGVVVLVWWLYFG